MNTKTKMILYVLGAIGSIFILPILIVLIWPSPASDFTFTLVCILTTAVPVTYCFIKLTKYRRLLDKEMELKNNKRNKSEQGDANTEETRNNSVGNIINLFLGIIILGVLINVGIDKMEIKGYGALIIAIALIIKSLIRLLIQLQDYLDKKQ